LKGGIHFEQKGACGAFLFKAARKSATSRPGLIIGSPAKSWD